MHYVNDGYMHTSMRLIIVCARAFLLVGLCYNGLMHNQVKQGCHHIEILREIGVFLKCIEKQILFWGGRCGGLF